MQRRDPNRSFSKWFFTFLALCSLALGVDHVGGQLRFRLPGIAGVVLFGPMAVLFWWFDRGRGQWLKPANHPASVSIRLTDDGFKWLHNGRVAGSIRWSNVRGIAAFNQATMVVDIVMLTFRVGPRDEWVQFTEDTDGIGVLVNAICTRFGVPPDWDFHVWHPPGQFNWRRLWGDAPPPGNRCWKCNYDLRGNESGVCPECGTIFVWPAPSAG